MKLRGSMRKREILKTIRSRVKNKMYIINAIIFFMTMLNDIHQIFESYGTLDK
jgi:hypothetical protein